ERAASNIFYTVYPHTFGIAQPVSSGQHGFMTSPNKNIFYSYQTPRGFATSIPYTGAPLHMNLWLFQGKSPINRKE
ncbi:unnamed protein product, partial [Adineta steineri]